MADNTGQDGTAVIATDDVATLNGAASSGIHVQRTKVAYGDDGTSRDVSATYPLPAAVPNTQTSGNLTAANANPSTGTATAGSSVQITVPDNHGSWSVTLSGTFTGTTMIHFQGSHDGTTWQPLNGRRNADVVANDTTTSLYADVPATIGVGNYRGNLAAIRYMRVTVSPFQAGDNIGVTITTSAAVGAVFMNAGLPGSTANIGALFPTPTYTVGTATGTTAATSGQIGRVVRATANVAQATAATLIAAPAAGTRLCVTNVACSNEGAALTVVRLFAGSLPAAAGAVAVVNDVWDFPIAASGGGAVMNFPPNAPWILPASTALSFAVTAATTWTISVSYYVSTA